MQSCNGNNTGSTSTTSDTSATKMNDTAGTMSQSSNTATDTSAKMNTAMNPADTLDKNAKNFVTKAARGGMMEVELGNVAQQQAKSQRVKDFGSMMVTDHTNANNELKSIASSKNVTVPDSLLPEERKHIDMLKKKTGTDFDKAYMNMMVEDHKKDVAEFKKESESSKNADIKNFAAKTLPVLQKHLDSAKAIHSSKM